MGSVIYIFIVINSRVQECPKVGEESSNNTVQMITAICIRICMFLCNNNLYTPTVKTFLNNYNKKGNYHIGDPTWVLYHKTKAMHLFKEMYKTLMSMYSIPLLETIIMVCHGATKPPFTLAKT